MDHTLPNRVLVLGVGAFTQAMLRVLREDGANIRAYLTRDYAHYGPRSEGPCVSARDLPNPCSWLRQEPPDLLVPMSLEWALRPWTAEFLTLGLPLLCPTGEGLRLERERDFARSLCERFGIPFPRARFVKTRAEAEALVRDSQRAFVLKNPLCSPTSPIHTVVCETFEDTLAWLPRLDDAEGIFLQEYLGRREAGHIALVSAGEIHPLVTNQEYKRAFDGNLGIVAGAPLGGLVERDPGDRYGLVGELLEPLLPWFRETGFHGPVQVTAIRDHDRWHVLEYNVRLGVTSGPMIARMLENPLETFRRCARNEPLALRWRSGREFGCNLTLAGYGYPFTQITGPRVPVSVDGEPDCDVWWQEVDSSRDGRLEATGHRLCDVAALAPSLPEAIESAYRNIRRIRSLGSYFRTDVGQSLWPPGNE
ncbi:MAG: phosphoribosylglycinamide synthetase C domain-containing protein [Verrucomicrobiota bacterium]